MALSVQFYSFATFLKKLFVSHGRTNIPRKPVVGLIDSKVSGNTTSSTALEILKRPIFLNNIIRKLSKIGTLRTTEFENVSNSRGCLKAEGGWTGNLYTYASTKR